MKKKKETKGKKQEQKKEKKQEQKKREKTQEQKKQRKTKRKKQKEKTITPPPRAKRAKLTQYAVYNYLHAMTFYAAGNSTLRGKNGMGFFTRLAQGASDISCGFHFLVQILVSF